MFGGAGRARQHCDASSIQRFAKHGKRNGNAAARRTAKAHLARRRRAAYELASASRTNPDHWADFLSLHKNNAVEQIAPRVSHWPPRRRCRSRRRRKQSGRGHHRSRFSGTTGTDRRAHSCATQYGQRLRTRTRSRRARCRRLSSKLCSSRDP